MKCKHFISIILAAVMMFTAVFSVSAVVIDAGGGSVGTGGATSNDNKQQSTANAVKISKINYNGSTLSKQWIVRRASAQTPSAYYYFRTSHKMYHKRNPGKSSVPTAQKGIPSAISVVTDSSLPLIYNANWSQNTNFSSQVKTYLNTAISGGKFDSASTVESWVNSGGYYIVEPLTAVRYRGTDFMMTPSEMAKLDISEGGTSSSISSLIRSNLSAYTHTQAPQILYATNSYSSLGITGGRPSKTAINNTAWYSPTILSSALGFGVISGTGKFTVTFNKNHSDSSGFKEASPRTRTVDYNEKTTAPGTSPTRTGYTFDSWRTTSGGSTAFDFSTKITAARTLYAKWNIRTYTVTFNKNNSDSGSTEANPKTRTVNHNATTTVPGTAPTRTGYTFGGWMTTSTGSTAFSTSTKHTSNTTYYAKWNIRSYTVTFDKNHSDASGWTNANPNTRTVNHNATTTAPGTAPTRTGYTFAGWVTTKTGTTAFSTATRHTANTTYYARWTQNPVITFDKNHNDTTFFTEANPRTRTVNYNAATTIPGTAPTRTGYTFAGWFADRNGTTAFSTATKHTADTMYYAKWNIIYYTVIFDLDGGIRNGGGALNQTVQYGGAATAPQVSKEDYFLVGWDKTFNFITENITVKAIWQLIPIENLEVNFITPNMEYTEGTEVISTFRVYNGGGARVKPDSGVRVSLNITHSGGNVAVSDVTNVVIPVANDNLVWFKWRVPNGTAGRVFTLTSRIIVNGTVQDTETVQRTIVAARNSQTPKTEFEKSKPSGWSKTNPPSYSTPLSASWSIWEFVGNAYVKRDFGTVMNMMVTIEPDINSPSREQKSNKWNMASGYGFTLKTNQIFTALGSRLTPSSSAFTHSQNGYAMFPEFNFANTNNKFRTLQNAGTGIFEFKFNSEAKNNAKLHFIPIWFPNGDYVVQTQHHDLWTPAGMLYGYQNSNAMNITESAFDDYYVGYSD